MRAWEEVFDQQLETLSKVAPPKSRPALPNPRPRPYPQPQTLSPTPTSTPALILTPSPALTLTPAPTLSKVDAPSWVQLDRADPTGEAAERCGSSIHAGLQVLFGWLTGSIWLFVVTGRARRQAAGHPDPGAAPPQHAAPASTASGSGKAR